MQLPLIPCEFDAHIRFLDAVKAKKDEWSERTDLEPEPEAKVVMKK
jgi:hypothetical protein